MADEPHPSFGDPPAGADGGARVPFARMTDVLLGRDDRQFGDGLRADLRSRVLDIGRTIERGLTGAEQLDPGALIRGVLARDDALIAELMAATRLAAIGEAMQPGAASGRAERVGLVVRLLDCPERDVAEAARALLVAENRPATLKPDLLQGATWRLAALIGDEAAANAAGWLARQEDAGQEAAAVRLAAAIDAWPDERAALFVDALDERRVLLFAALLGHAVGFDLEAAREALLSTGDMLALSLRALELDRTTIARVQVALASGDPRRDLDQIANRLDWVASLDPAAAMRSIAGWRRPAPYRRGRREVAR